MKIRLVTPEDVPKLVEFGYAYSSQWNVPGRFSEIRLLESLDHALTETTLFCFLAIDENGEIAGFLTADRGRFLITDEVFFKKGLFFVRPDKRGTRAATALFDAFVRFGEACGAVSQFADFHLDDQGARVGRFMRRHGFKPDMVVMRRTKGFDNGNGGRVKRRSVGTEGPASGRTGADRRRKRRD